MTSTPGALASPSSADGGNSKPAKLLLLLFAWYNSQKKKQRTPAHQARGSTYGRFTCFVHSNALKQAPHRKTETWQPPITKSAPSSSSWIV